MKKPQKDGAAPTVEMTMGIGRLSAVDVEEQKDLINNQPEAK